MTSNQKQAEALLGVSLPASARDIQFVRYQPSPQVSFFEAYLRFAAPPSALVELRDSLHMTAFGAGGDAAKHLPAAWRHQPGATVPFWDATPDTPRESAAKSIGRSGWIVAKYEREHVYVIVTDAGP